MQLQHTALSTTRDPIDAFVSGDPKEYSVEADVPFAFPPVADFPKGGMFLINVPAGAVLKLRRTADGDGFTLLPGIHRRVFRAAESHVLTAAGDITIEVEANDQLGGENV